MLGPFRKEYLLREDSLQAYQSLLLGGTEASGDSDVAGGEEVESGEKGEGRVSAVEEGKMEEEEETREEANLSQPRNRGKRKFVREPPHCGQYRMTRKSLTQ